MGEMHDSDWSRENLLRSDWLLLNGAIMTTHILDELHAIAEKITKHYDSLFTEGVFT